MHFGVGDFSRRIPSVVRRNLDRHRALLLMSRPHRAGLQPENIKRYARGALTNVWLEAAGESGLTASVPASARARPRDGERMSTGVASRLGGHDDDLRQREVFRVC